MNRSRINFSLLLIISGMLFVFSSCNRSGNKAKIAENLPPGTHAVSVIEVVQSSNYTYLQVYENNTKYWMAIALQEAKPGDVLYFTDVLEMRDFESKELGRTFPVIYFVQDPSDQPNGMNAESQTQGRKRLGKMNGIEVEALTDGINIGTLFEKRKDFDNKKVKIRAMVVKYNDNIMGKNWIHIQDGSGFDENFDLTVTSGEKAEIGSIITVEGIIRLNKDFGSGYAYDVLMEDATLSDVKAAPDANL